MATTYNFTDGSITGQPKPTEALPNTGGLLSYGRILLTFRLQTLDAGEADVAQVINIPG